MFTRPDGGLAYELAGAAVTSSFAGRRKVPHLTRQPFGERSCPGVSYEGSSAGMKDLDGRIVPGGNGQPAEAGPIS